MKLFFKRILAYFIDITVISLLIYMLSNMPINPNYNSVKKINNDIVKITKEYNNILLESEKVLNINNKEIDNFDINMIKIKNKKYLNNLNKILSDNKIDKLEKNEYINSVNKDYQIKTSDLMYELKKESYFQIIVTLIISFLYFVIFQYIMDGETLGRKLTNIRLTTQNGEKLTYKNLIVRWLILYGIYSMIIETIFLYSFNKNVYMTTINYLNTVFSFIQMLIIFTTFIQPEGKGLHDVIAKTKVINLKNK